MSNPASTLKMTFAEAEKALEDLRASKRALTEEKFKLDQDVHAIKARFKDRLPKDEYTKLQNERAKIVKRIMEIEKAVRALNVQKGLLLKVLENSSLLSWTDVVQRLRRLRHTYETYGDDPTHSPEVVGLATKITESLEVLIGDIIRRGGRQ